MAVRVCLVLCGANSEVISTASQSERAAPLSGQSNQSVWGVEGKLVRLRILSHGSIIVLIKVMRNADVSTFVGLSCFECVVNCQDLESLSRWNWRDHEMPSLEHIQHTYKYMIIYNHIMIWNDICIFKNSINTFFSRAAKKSPVSHMLSRIRSLQSLHLLKA